MEIIENISEYQNYWETNKFWNEDCQLDFSWGTDQPFNFQYGDSSSRDGTASATDGDSSLRDGTASATASQNIVTERKRRRKLGDKLLELRGVVPKISKLDKASIIKDAIQYVQDLQEEERILEAEIIELESKRMLKKTTPAAGYDFEHELPVLLRSKKTRFDQMFDQRSTAICWPIEVHDLRITSMGENTLFVTLTCSKTPQTMMKLCEVFESLNVKIITANMIILSEMVKKTVLIEADEEEKDLLKLKIETAIWTLSDSYSSILRV